MQHGLGQVVDRLGDVFVGGRGSGHIPAEQAEKTDQHFDVLHGCFLIVVGRCKGNMSLVMLSYNIAIVAGLLESKI